MGNTHDNKRSKQSYNLENDLGDHLKIISRINSVLDEKIEAYIQGNAVTAGQHQSADFHIAGSVSTTSRTSDSVINSWIYSPDVPKAFEAARGMIIVSDQWMSKTKVQGFSSFIKEHIRSSSELRSGLWKQNVYAITVHQLLEDAYPDINPFHVRDPSTGLNVYNILIDSWDEFGSKQPYIHFALAILLLCMPSEQVGQVICFFIQKILISQSAKSSAFPYIMQVAEKCMTAYILACICEAGHDEEFIDPVSPKRLQPIMEMGMSHDRARKRLHEIFSEYIELHKMNAFNSSMLEPAKAYFRALKLDFNSNFVEEYGIHWYSALIMYTLGIRIPFSPVIDETFSLGVGDHWLSPELVQIWPEISKPENFGLSYNSVPAMRNLNVSWRNSRKNVLVSKKLKNPQQFIEELSSSPKAQKFAGEYAEKFAYFFSESFFIPQMFEFLNNENLAIMDPKFHGFQDGLQVIFEEMKHKGLILTEAQDYMDWVYDGTTMLQVHRLRQITDFLEFTVTE